MKIGSSARRLEGRHPLREQASHEPAQHIACPGGGVAVGRELLVMVERIAVVELVAVTVVAAFALTRGVGLVRVSPGCDAIPLSCGAPLGYLDWAMLGQLASGVASRFVASVRKNSAAGSKSGSGAGGFLAGKLRAA
mgnify:CR=1 FL=1